jgi:MOSC domain-containing protein YiiM
LVSRRFSSHAHACLVGSPAGDDDRRRAPVVPKPPERPPSWPSQQGDLAGHGGEQRAVLVYQIDSYQYWQRYFGRDDLSHGSFGENFTVDGLPDHDVCIGDRYRIGQAEFEVTQPRVTCYRGGLRLGEPELPALLVGHHRPGFYMRVITEGHIRAGDAIVKTRTGPHALSVADTDAPRRRAAPDQDIRHEVPGSG